MVVVSHLFFFLWKKLVRGAAHMSRPSHYLELSISRQPLFLFFHTPIKAEVKYVPIPHPIPAVHWNALPVSQ